MIVWRHPVDDAGCWEGFHDSGIETFAGSPIFSLAREVVQNSLDARDSDTVIVEFKLHEVPLKTIPGLEEFKENLRECLVAAKNESDKAEIFFEQAINVANKKTIKVLEISDKNTKGMKGPSKNGTPFYAFMKASGQSKKDSSTATGSYGIGKFAPYCASKLRTIFLSTIYRDDTGGFSQLTQGKSILMSHHCNGVLRRGVGFWGVRERCAPVEGVCNDLPSWLLRANSEKEFSTKAGSKLSVLGFDDSQKWEEFIAVSVAENFFAAVADGILRVIINGRFDLDRNSIHDFFENRNIRDTIKELNCEPERFDSSRLYLQARSDSPEVIIEESQRLDLGYCKLRLIVSENFPKKVCILRNGMFITDSLSRLKSFSGMKEFVAVFSCESTKGNELLRLMEPPRHDDFEPERLPKRDDQKKGARALKDLSDWVREVLKRHAKEKVSEVTKIDELIEFFAEEGSEGGGKGTGDINPFGTVLIRAKPINMPIAATKKIEDGEEPGEGEGGSGGGGGGGRGGGGGMGGKGQGQGGTGGGRSEKAVELNNVRAVLLGRKNRKISFTPQKSCKIEIRVQEAGADADYNVSVVSSSAGVVENGSIVMDVEAAMRCTLEIELAQQFSGAVKVVAHEI